MTDAKKSSKKVKSAVPEEADAAEFSIKPEKGLPQMDTSSWPLLLKVMYLLQSTSPTRKSKSRRHSEMNLGA
jgi:hypothetical protein